MHWKPELFGKRPNAYVPAVGITQDAGKALLDKLKNGEALKASINIEGAEGGMRTSYNVIATKAPTIELPPLTVLKWGIPANTTLSSSL